MREVQFAAGGRQIAPTFPLTDARFFGTPIKWGRPFIVKRGRCNFSAGGREIAPTFPLIGTPTHRERPLIGNTIALDSRERPIDNRERPVL